MSNSTKMRLPNGMIVDLARPPARHSVELAPEQPIYESTARLTTTYDRHGRVVPETGQSDPGERYGPPAPLGGFSAEETNWLGENWGHLFDSDVSRASRAIVDETAAQHAARRPHLGVGFNPDGSQVMHAQQPLHGYETPDRAFRRPGETEVERYNRVAQQDNTAAVHFARQEAAEYVKRHGLL